MTPLSLLRSVDRVRSEYFGGSGRSAFTANAKLKAGARQIKSRRPLMNF
ncbi:MAG: hypothetical protein ABI262_18560 [Microcoleus sp.]